MPPMSTQLVLQDSTVQMEAFFNGSTLNLSVMTQVINTLHTLYSTMPYLNFLYALETIPNTFLMEINFADGRLCWRVDTFSGAGDGDPSIAVVIQNGFHQSELAAIRAAEAQCILLKTTFGLTNLLSIPSASIAPPPPVPPPSGQAGAPIILSPLTANGRKNVAFTYQITSTDMPTSFGASGLAPGLSINTANGLISGTPAGNSPGIYNIIISATNAIGTGAATLVLTIIP